MTKRSKTKSKVEPPKKRGRPKSIEPLPKVRQIGRIHDERWDLWQHATKLSEATFTDWASAALDKQAKADLKKHGLI